MVSEKLFLKAIAGLTGVAFLGLSALSFAGGDYVAAPAPAASPVAGVEEGGKTGFYAGVRAGYANTHWDKALSSREERQAVNVNHTGFAGGLNIGYAFSKFLSAEAGYTYLPQAKFTAKGISAKDLNLKVTNHAFDVSLKGTMPIPSMENFGVYGKVGVASVSSKTTFHAPVFGLKDESESVRNTSLTYGLGAYFDVSQSVRIDGGWQRWQGHGHSTDKYDQSKDKYHPVMDAFTLGVSYYFGGSNDLFNS